MAKKVATEKAPAAIGPYSQAMIVGNLVFTSGQIPIHPASGNIEVTDIAGQTEQVMKNLGEVLERLRKRFPGEWTPNRRGYRLGEGVYLEWGELFDWPTTDGSVPDYGPRTHCFAMKDHVAVLCDGCVLPCCIDCDGVMPLGNLNEASLADILNGEAAQAFLRALADHRLDYPLCRHCNFK
jgi:radical SAM protein with 4Fe4S-binding SPASM domain